MGTFAGDQTPANRRPGPEDDELDLSLIEGVQPGDYVLITWEELAHQIKASFLDTPDHNGKHRPHRAVARLALVLGDMGYLHHVRGQLSASTGRQRP